MKDREAIARIIDPTAKFEDIEGVSWSKFEIQRRELAYQKADAILALSDSSTLRHAQRPIEPTVSELIAWFKSRSHGADAWGATVRDIERALSSLSATSAPDRKGEQ